MTYELRAVAADFILIETLSVNSSLAGSSNESNLALDVAWDYCREIESWMWNLIRSSKRSTYENVVKVVHAGAYHCGWRILTRSYRRKIVQPLTAVTAVCFLTTLSWRWYPGSKREKTTTFELSEILRSKAPKRHTLYKLLRLCSRADLDSCAKWRYINPLLSNVSSTWNNYKT